MKWLTLSLALLLPVTAQIKRPVRKSLLDNDPRVGGHVGRERTDGRAIHSLIDVIRTPPGFKQGTAAQVRHSRRTLGCWLTVLFAYDEYLTLVHGRLPRESVERKQSSRGNTVYLGDGCETLAFDDSVILVSQNAGGVHQFFGGRFGRDRRLLSRIQCG
jgi:hypothetical protein